MRKINGKKTGSLIFIIILRFYSISELRLLAIRLYSTSKSSYVYENDLIWWKTDEWAYIMKWKYMMIGRLKSFCLKIYSYDFEI